MTDSRENELLKAIADRDEKIAMLEQENSLLRQKVDLLVKRVFGSSSEKLDSKQLELLLGLGEAGKECASSEKEEASSNIVPMEAPAARKPKRERTQRIPENLPVIEEIIEPEIVKEAPQDWRRIGEEVNEQLDYEPAHFFCRRTVRPKYVNRKEADAAPIAAPLPPALQERCIAAPGLLAQVIVSKYCDHLPLYRQEYIYSSRHGVWLPRQTMARWVDLVAFWLKPISVGMQPPGSRRGFSLGNQPFGAMHRQHHPGGFCGRGPMRCLCGLRQLCEAAGPPAAPGHARWLHGPCATQIFRSQRAGAPSSGLGAAAVSKSLRNRRAAAKRTSRPEGARSSAGG